MKRMLISVDHDEWRAAVVNDGRLEQLEIEPVARDSCKGNIYRAVIARVEPSLQSAFVDFGRDKQGFLPVGEIHPKLRPANVDKRAPIQEQIKAGREILVQVVRDEIGNKGATLSTFVSLPGRYLVLMPESEKSGVSRKLGDAARARVKDLTENMKVPDGFGLIVRTAGETATKLELSKDLVYLNRLWAHINKSFESGKGAELLYMERTLPVRFVRDYFMRDVNEVIVDDEDTLAEVASYIKLLMPRNLSAIERYSGAVPLFARYGIQGQVESVFSRQVPLPSGGSIVIDQTEALVSVDVNSGRVKGKDIEETARATNIEAAQEIARQLVLRDLGGLVVVDFIDMRERKYVREVEAAVKQAMKSDKARHKIGDISEFGLLELSRQRLKSSVNKGVFEPCKHCSGTGFYRTTAAVASSVMRRIYEYIAQGEVRYVIALVPPDAASYLLNSKRKELAMVEREYHVSIEIVAVEGMTPADVTIERLETEPSRTGAERMEEDRTRRITLQLDLVRNRLIKREETRLHRAELARRSGAMVDFGKVYTEVQELTRDAAEQEERDTARRDRQRDRKQREREVEEVVVEPVAETVYAPLPRSGGLGAWLKGLFGFGRPEPTVEVEPPAQLPAESAKAAAAVAEADGDDDDDDRRGPRRGRRGGRRRRGSERDEVQPEAPPSAPKVETRERDRDAVQDGESETNRRKRRRRRGRGDKPIEEREGGTDSPASASAEAESGSNRDESGRRRRGRGRSGDKRGEGDSGRGRSNARSGDRDASSDEGQDQAATGAEGDEASGHERSRRDRDHGPRRTRRSGGLDGNEASGELDSSEEAQVADYPEERAALAAATLTPSSAPEVTTAEDDNHAEGAGDAHEVMSADEEIASARDAEASEQLDAAPQVAAAAGVDPDAQAETDPEDLEQGEDDEAEAASLEAALPADAEEPAEPQAEGGDTQAPEPMVAVPMADARSLVRREIERLQGGALESVDATVAGDAPAAPPPLPAATKPEGNRFVVDLRSGS